MLSEKTKRVALKQIEMLESMLKDRKKNKIEKVQLNETFASVATKHGKAVAKKWKIMKAKADKMKNTTVKVSKDGKVTIEKMTPEQIKANKMKSAKMKGKKKIVSASEKAKTAKTKAKNKKKFGENKVSDVAMKLKELESLINESKEIETKEKLDEGITGYKASEVAQEILQDWNWLKYKILDDEVEIDVSKENRSEIKELTRQLEREIEFKGWDLAVTNDPRTETLRIW